MKIIHPLARRELEKDVSFVIYVKRENTNAYSLRERGGCWRTIASYKILRIFDIGGRTWHVASSLFWKIMIAYFSFGKYPRVRHFTVDWMVLCSNGTLAFPLCVLRKWRKKRGQYFMALWTQQ